MDPQVPTSASDLAGDEEWEVCCEDGFVYKRRKRQRINEEIPAGEASKAPDPAEEERNLKERKRRILVKLKRKYQKEIDDWEILSNNLCAIQEKSNQFQTAQAEISRNPEETASLPEPSSSVTAREQMERASSSSSSAQHSFLDELLAMEEAREGIIETVSKVCEIAEEMCRVEEEEEKERLYNLPVWGTPKDLMASLCFDET